MVRKLNTPTAAWIKTTQTGISFREYSSPLHRTKSDRYYREPFKPGGKQITECYGWASKGQTLRKCAATMVEMKQELKAGTGTGKLADHRKSLAKEKNRRRGKKLRTIGLPPPIPTISRITIGRISLRLKKKPLSRRKSASKITGYSRELF